MVCPQEASQEAWRLTVNTNYQEVMKTLMSLVTPSLVLPFFFIRNFIGIPEGKSIAEYLRKSAYWSWSLLFLCLLCGMVFYFSSAKYVKAIMECRDTWFVENVRDFSAILAVVSFVAGLLGLGWFFTHLRKQP